jgi:RNA polymerase sigma factor (sigma-70 family)
MRQAYVAETAMADLARRRGKALVAYAYLLCGDMAEAEDLVQDALIKVFLRPRALDPATVEAYVRRAVLTLYLDGYRRRRSFTALRHLVAVGDAVDGPSGEVSVRADVRAALRALPPQQRACVVLRFYEDLTTTEIADRMNLGTGTVKRYLSLAVRRLEGLLGPVRQDDVEIMDGGRA